MESEALQPLLEAMKESAEKQIRQPQSNAHATLRALLVKALNEPTIFCGFDEIKRVLQPALMSSSSSSSSSNTAANNNNQILLSTLDLFSYGVYQDYQTASPGTYLTLTDSQVFKLRQLTLLTLVEQQAMETSAASSSGHKCNVVLYQTLAQHLGFNDQENDPATSNPLQQGTALSAAFRQVEEVITACLYAGIVSGRLCQKSLSLVVGGSTGMGGLMIQSRDVPNAKVPTLFHQCNDLYQSLEHCSHQLELQASHVQKVRSDQDQYWQSVNEAKKAIITTAPGGSSTISSSRFFGALTAPLAGFATHEDEGDMANPSEPGMAGTTTSNRSSPKAPTRRLTKRSRGGFGSSAQ